MEPEKQLKTLENIGANLPFGDKISQTLGAPLHASAIETLQVNVGRLCNLNCRHCHLEAGPQRDERMGRAVMEKCVDAVTRSDIAAIDITGGAPELNPEIRWFIRSAAGTGRRVIFRSNLVLLADERYRDIIDVLAENRIKIAASLPGYSESASDRQRGKGNFQRAIHGMTLLNSAGYGQPETGLHLDIVHNPAGAFLPGTQEALEREYRERLLRDHGIVFNNLFCITNMPVGRFLENLIRTGNYDDYFTALCSAYNPAAAGNVMCRSILSVGWDGSLYDCDFNQALGLPVANGQPSTIDGFDYGQLSNRRIAIHNHCYGCCAGAGSSCQGTTAS